MRPYGSIGGSGVRPSPTPFCVPCWHEQTRTPCEFRRSLTGARIVTTILQRKSVECGVRSRLVGGIS